MDIASRWPLPAQVRFRDQCQYVRIGLSEHRQSTVQMHRTTLRMSRFPLLCCLQECNQPVSRLAPDGIKVRGGERSIKSVQLEWDVLFDLGYVTKVNHIPRLP